MTIDPNANAMTDAEADKLRAQWAEQDKCRVCGAPGVRRLRKDHRALNAPCEAMCVMTDGWVGQTHPDTCGCPK